MVIPDRPQGSEKLEETFVRTAVAADGTVTLVAKTADDTVERSAEVLATATLTADMVEFLEKDTLHNVGAVQILGDAVIYLQLPTGNIDDLERHGRNIGKVWAALGERQNSSPAVDALHAHFCRLRYEYYLGLLMQELEREPQDMIRISDALSFVHGKAMQRFTRHNDHALPREMKQFLDQYKMTSKGETKKNVTCVADSAPVIDDVEIFLKSGACTDPIDVQTFEAALVYLRSPTGKVPDLRKHIDDVGMTVAQMAEVPPSIQAMNLQFPKLLLKHHIDALQTALHRQPQDMVEIVAAMVLVRSVDVEASGGDKDLSKDLVDFLQSYEMQLIA